MSAPPLSPDHPLAQALDRDRGRYNRRFAAQRQLHRTLAPEAVQQALAMYIAPLVEAAAAAAPRQVGAVVDACFDATLELLARECLGPDSHCPLVHSAWKRLFTSAPALLAAAPGRLVPAVANAVYNLTLQPGARPGQWVELIAACAPACRDAEMFLAAGAVAAWRSGMAHWREGALTAWEGLPDPLAGLALGLGPAVTGRELAPAVRDPWQDPTSTAAPALQLVGRIGGFQGFDGPFLSPPEVAVRAGRLYAFDGAFCWSLHTDRYGATCQRFGADLPADLEEQNTALRLTRRGVLSWQGETVELTLLANALSAAATADTVAVTLPHSHFVYLAARVAAPPWNKAGEA